MARRGYQPANPLYGAAYGQDAQYGLPGGYSSATQQALAGSPYEPLMPYAGAQMTAAGYEPQNEPGGQLSDMAMGGYGGGGGGRAERLQLTPEEHQSILKTVVAKTGSGLQYAGSSIDKPGAAVRGVLSGLGVGSKAGDWGGGLLNLIPFSDWMGLTDPEKRIQAEDLTGLKSEDSDPWYEKLGKFGANLGVGVVTDPLFWATSGILPAMSKGGEALRAAGVMSKADLLGMARGAGMGSREFLASHTPEMILGGMGDAERAAAMDKLGTFLGKRGAQYADIKDSPLGGLMNLGPFGGGGRSPWATIGTGETAQKVARVMDKGGAWVAGLPGIRNANALLNQWGTQGMLSKAGQASAPAFSEAAEEAKFAENAAAGKLNRMLSQHPETPRDVLLRAADAPNGNQLSDALKTLADTHGWKPEEAQAYRDLWDSLREQGTTREMGANANTFSSPYASYTSRSAVPGAFEDDILGGTARSQRGIVAGGPSDIARNLALDLPGGQARVEKLFSDPNLAKSVKLAQSLPGGLDEPELAAILKKMPTNKDIPDYFLDQEGWKKVRKFANDNEIAIPDDPQQLLGLAKLAGAETKDRFGELAKVYLRATPEGRAAGLFGEPLEQIAGRMAKDQAMRAAHGNLLADMLSQPNALSEAGIVTREGKNGAARIFRPTVGAKPATVGDVATQASLLHGSEDEGFLPYIAKKLGVDPTDEEAMQRLKLSAVDPEIVKDITGFHKRYDAPESTNNLLSLLDQMTGIFKTSVLSRPMFPVRSEFSHGIQTGLHGMHSAEGDVQMAKFFGGGRLDPAKIFDIPEFAARAKEMGIDTAKATAQDARDVVSSSVNEFWKGKLHGASSPLVNEGTGVVNPMADFAAGQVGGTPVTPGSVAKKFAGIGSGTPMNLGQAAKDWRDPLAALRETGPVAAMNDLNAVSMAHPRLASWYGLLKQGYDPAEAVRMVEDKLFRYGTESFTPFENKVMKRLVPFYSFAKQGATVTGKELLEHPGGPTAQVIKATGQMTGSDDQMIPDYIKQGMAIPIPSGTPVIGPEPGGLPRYLTTVGMMHERYPFGFMGGGLRGAGLEALAQTNPLLKTFIEGATGVSTFQRGPGGGRELTEQDPLLGRLIANIHDTYEDPMSMLRGEGQYKTGKVSPVPYLENAIDNSPLSAALSAARTMFDPRKNLATKLTNLLTGARLTDVTQSSQEAMLEDAMKEEMKEGGARTYSNTYFPQSVLANMPPEQRVSAARMQAFMAELAKMERQQAKQRAYQQPTNPILQMFQ